MSKEMEFSLETKAAVEQAFLVAELAVGPLSAAMFEYKKWGDELHRGDISVTKKGSKANPVSIQDYASRASEELFGNLNTALDKVFKLGLQEIPSRDKIDRSSGEIYVSRVGNTQLSVEWKHTDQFTFSEEAAGACLDSKTWRQLHKQVAKLGAHALFIEYGGSGDSMDGASYHFTDKDGNEMKVSSTDPAFEKIDRIFDLLMNGPVDGFWTDEGGHGEILVKENQGDSYWSHWNYFSDTETFTGVFVISTVTPKQVSTNDLIEAVADPVWS
ncbi:hypothetical protein [Acidithiobacillus thiooxidans]|uniref:hypothetical protein n=1 Tax=Acidithiobacillus thiooxidans TaxID=930 RepID=UPI0004E10D81|nr:hypothetical protein [Acidithiobacillus thiooxidans]